MLDVLEEKLFYRQSPAFPLFCYFSSMIGRKTDDERIFRNPECQLSDVSLRRQSEIEPQRKMMKRRRTCTGKWGNMATSIIGGKFTGGFNIIVEKGSLHQ